MQPFGYTGYRYDTVADTYFAQAREYMPGLGRFGGEDWIKGSIRYPTSLNGYGYCYGNPIGLVDRDGLLPETPLVGVPIETISNSKDSKINSTNVIQDFVKNKTKVDITKSESYLILAYPKEAMIVRDTAKLADEWTDKTFKSYYHELDKKKYELTHDPQFGPHWQDGDAANAYRHAMWNALLTQVFMSSANAQMWTNAHEDWPKEILDMPHAGGFTRRDHTIMDLHNNAVGRSLIKPWDYFTSQEEISNRVIEKLKNGELKYLVNYGWYDGFFNCETSK